MYTSNDLAASVKGRANIPISQNTFQAADLYRFGDEEIKTRVLPMILKHMEEYYVRYVDYTIVNGQSNYLIPTRAVMSKLRDVELISSTAPASRIPLERLTREDLSLMRSGHAVYKSGFYLEGNSVVLFNVQPASGYNLRLAYYCAPSSLIDVSAAAQIIGINWTTNSITVSSVPSNYSSNTILDFVKSNPGFECSAIDQTPVSVSANIFTFASLPVDLAVGDYLCPAKSSCVVQIPAELHPLLSAAVVVRVLSAQSDTNALKVAMAELQSLQAYADELLSPRVDGKPKKAVSGRGIGRFF
jgi:hypothetical protein